MVPTANRRNTSNADLSSGVTRTVSTLHRGGGSSNGTCRPVGPDIDQAPWAVQGIRSRIVRYTVVVQHERSVLAWTTEGRRTRLCIQPGITDE